MPGTRGRSVPYPAIWLAGDDARIVIARTDQPYRESFTIGGGRTEPVGRARQRRVIDGSIPVPEDAWEHVQGDARTPGEWPFRPRAMAYQQLFLDGKPLAAETTAGWKVRRNWTPCNGPWSMVAFTFAAARQGSAEHGPELQGETVGITLYGVERVVVSDLVVQGFQLDGINACSSAADCRLMRLVCRSNGRSGISVGTASVVADRCRLANNGVAQLRTQGGGLARMHCQFVRSTAPDWTRKGGRLFIDGVEMLGAPARGSDAAMHLAGENVTHAL